jgi:hypothetical protein
MLSESVATGILSCVSVLVFVAVALKIEMSTRRAVRAIKNGLKSMQLIFCKNISLKFSNNTKRMCYSA